MFNVQRKLYIQSKNYFSVLKIIKSKNHKVRLIGGIVRDSILGIESHDVDIATSMRPEVVLKTFNSLGFTAIPTGIKFGTVTVLCNGEVFEITTLRKDISSNGRHPKIEYTDNFYLDALRRDFTINALSYCPFKEKIYDYFTGIKDLELGLVRFIGNANSRIMEDYLRILRFFRFFGKFGKQIDVNSLDSCVKNREFIKKISKERIKSEFDSILKLPNYCELIILMNNLSVLQEILPISIIKLNQFISAEDLSYRLTIELNHETKYALLFALGGFLTYVDLINLKFSRIEAKSISDLLLILKSRKSIDKIFLKKIWLEKNNFSQYFIFLASIFQLEKEIEAMFLSLKNRKRPLFPINGKDIIYLGFSGRTVGVILNSIKIKWIESDCTLLKEDLVKIKEKYEKYNY